MKIVINRCFGGFGLSDVAIQRYGELAGLNLVADDDREFGITWYLDSIDDKNYFDQYSILRNDPYLVQVVEELGKESWDSFSELAVIEIPDNVKWNIKAYDGNEHVAEHHRTWQ